jgi:hypothetical protein
MGLSKPTGTNVIFGQRYHRALSEPHHASTRTTPLYDARRDEMSLDEVERVMI